MGRWKSGQMSQALPCLSRLWMGELGCHSHLLGSLAMQVRGPDVIQSPSLWAECSLGGVWRQSLVSSPRIWI